MGQSKFLEEEISFSGTFSKSVFNTIVKSFWEFRFRIALLFVFGLIGRVLLLFTANVMGYWADSMCQPVATCKPIPEFFKGYTNQNFVNFLILIAIVGFIINTIFRVAISRTGSRAVSLLYDEVTIRTSRLPMTFFDATPVGRIVTRFSSDYAAIFRMAGGPLGEFLCLLFDLILMCVLTTMASPYFLPVLVLVVVTNFYAYRKSNVGLRVERRALAKQRSPSIAHFSETVQGASTVKVFGKRKSFVDRYDLLMSDFLQQKIKTAIAVNFFSFKMMTITAIMMLLTGLAGMWMAIAGLITIGSLGVAFTFIMMTSTTIQQFFEWLASLEEALTGIERMDDYLRRPMELGARMPRHAKFRESEPQQFSEAQKQLFPSISSIAGVESLITVENLTMRYRADLDPVLSQLNFSIQPGEQFAIIGRTGSGKSSLIQALFCLYPPELGCIKIGGFAADLLGLKETPEQLLHRNLLPVDEYRKRMALIPQDPNLFRGTIRENLTGGQSKTDAQLWSSLENIGIASWVRSLNHQGRIGLDFVLDEGAKNISVGERQLLCMSRALLQDTPIIIMDEATSSIDPASEELLVKATQIHMRQKTRIVVAHRLSTIEKADRVLWLDRGRIKMLDRPEIVLPKFHEAEL